MACLCAGLLQSKAWGFILDKKIGVGQPHRITDAKVLIANTPMDTDKIKIYGARVRVDSMAKVRPVGSTSQTAPTHNLRLWPVVSLKRLSICDWRSLYSMRRWQTKSASEISTC